MYERVSPLPWPGSQKGSSWLTSYLLNTHPHHYEAKRRIEMALGIIGLLILGLLLACAPLTWCVLALASIAGLTALLLNPALGLYALAFTIPFGSAITMPLNLPFGPSEVVLGATVLAYVLRAVALRQDDLNWHPLILLWVIYALVLGFSFLVASNLQEAALELAKWIELIIVALIVSNLHNAQKTKLLVLALLLAAIAQAALGLYQFVFQVGPEGFVLMGRFMRAYGTFDQPNPFGGYLGLVLPLAYGIVYTGFGKLKATAAQKDWLTIALFWVALVACVALTGGVAASWSRGALLGLAAGLVLVILALGPRIWLTVSLVALLIVAAVPVEQYLSGGDIIERLIEPVALLQNGDLATIEITDSNFSTVERAAHWLAAWRMFEQSPWTGVGLGQYATVYPEVAVPRWQDPLGHAHNIYLNLLAENGIPGLLAFLGVMIAWIAAAWRTIRRSSGWQRALAIGVLGMLGHLAAHSLVDNLFVHDMYLYMGVMFGLLIAQSTSASTESNQCPN